MLQSGSVAKNLRLLLELWWNPAAAMSAILDRGSLLFACLAALAVGLFEGGCPLGFYVPLLLLAAAYVPGILLIAGLLGRFEGFAPDFRRDYSPLLTSIAMAWTAANLPLLPAIWLLGAPVIVLVLAAGCLLYFTLLVSLAVRTVLGASNGAAAVTAVLSWVPMVAVAFAWGPIRMVLAWVASPFFILFAWYYLGSEFAGLGAGLRERQNFRRMLEASALNPHDGNAQYQLGLIYQQRRQYTEAIQRFRNAVAIDPTEADAHFQLGRIAREQGRTADALAHFQEVLRLDDKHSLSEIHRETGAAYLAAGNLEQARRELATYTERRTHDPEGLFWYGQTLERLGDGPQAREMYQRAVEAACTAPRYIRRATARWSRLAQKQLRHLISHPTSAARWA
jgi:tetratricopeptide (TPR) repeat protein